MNRYEIIFISDLDLSEEIRGQLFEKTKNLIEKQNGYLCSFDEWGNKKLAYEIKKKDRGYYVRIDYCGDGALVKEMERSFRIDDRVLKFMTILLEKDIDLELLKEEIEREKEAESDKIETETAKTATEAVKKPAETAEKETEAAEKPAETAEKETEAVEKTAEASETEVEEKENKTAPVDPEESPDAPKADI